MQNLVADTRAESRGVCGWRRTTVPNAVLTSRGKELHYLGYDRGPWPLRLPLKISKLLPLDEGALGFDGQNGEDARS